ncbi:MAG TPA: ATP-binding protein, partial [Anaeromyxobacteraceae bacterium]|nr:ATP-binding protein [Anaeromyxobacteraceae bacterium]
IELASFAPVDPNHLAFLDQLMDRVGVMLNMIDSSMRMEGLLQELKRSNAELEAQAGELNEKARLLEQKNSEVEMASRSLEEKAEQLQLISRYKSEFLANMSHELRTPLNSLLILSKMLSENRDGNLTEEQVKFASTVYTSGTELLALINEVLDLSKVEAGKMPIEPREAPLAEVHDYLEQSFRHVADHRGLGFEVRMTAGLPERLHTDVVRLEQILKNLLSNAFKFTERGSVSLTMDAAHRTRPGARGMLAFSVRDTGIGIPKEKQRIIFEAFQQADGTTSRRYGGTGLGLTISREIARLLGGSLSVESTPGLGSTFTLQIPLRYAGPEASRDPGLTLASQEGAEAYPALPAGLDLSGRTVLLADDDVRNLFAINSVLESAHMKVIHAHDGREALRVLEESPRVDLVLMDTMMPGLDGLSAIRAIRAQPRWRGLPIVSLTAKAMKGDRESALAAGASDYVAKPVDPERLLSVVHRWLSGVAPPPEQPEAGGEVWN